MQISIELNDEQIAIIIKAGKKLGFDMWDSLHEFEKSVTTYVNSETSNLEDTLNDWPLDTPKINRYELGEYVFYAEQCVNGILINPVLPTDWVDEALEYKDTGESKWKNRYFIETENFDDIYKRYAIYYQGFRFSEPDHIDSFVEFLGFLKKEPFVLCEALKQFPYLNCVEN